jgi:hypothetical protein
VHLSRKRKVSARRSLRWRRSIDATFKLVAADGLALNVMGTAAIFMFAYPPEDERRRRFFLLLTRLALILMLSGFPLQFLAAWLGH